MPLEIEILLEETYINSLNCNGIHGVKFIRDIKLNKIIKWYDYNLMTPYEKKYCKIFTHLGIKHQIKDDIWALTLATSQTITEINNFKFFNMQLSNNVHRYINPPIIGNNSIISEYFVFENSISSYPKYCTDLLVAGNEVEILNKIHEDMLEAYKKSLWKYNFNNTIIVQDWIFNSYKIKLDLIRDENLIYENSKDYLKFKEITNTDIIIFIENVFENKNIKGEKFIKKENIIELLNEYKKIKIKKIKY